MGVPAVTTTNDAIPSAEPSSLLLSAETLAKRLEISLRSLWRLRAGGRLPPPIRLGGTVRWRSTDIDAWVAAGCPNSQPHNNNGRK